MKQNSVSLALMKVLILTNGYLTYMDKSLFKNSSGTVGSFVANQTNPATGNSSGVCNGGGYWSGCQLTTKLSTKFRFTVEMEFYPNNTYHTGTLLGFSIYDGTNQQRLMVITGIPTVELIGVTFSGYHSYLSGTV